jgi:L-ascorbate metabolism protein UlaG (beta-lactamase superfamily)
MNAPRYQNLEGSTWSLPALALLRWQLTRTFQGRWTKRRLPALPKVWENDGRQLRKLRPHLTWIGHATFVLRLGGKLVATDPVWSDRVWAYRRQTPAGVPLHRLPNLDVVTISHNHYDHLDLPTLKRLRRAYDPLFVVPARNGSLLRQAGIDKIVELEWFESHQLGGLQITLVPAQHWSARSWFDKNRRLWGGYLFRSSEGTAYHAGDTAYSAGVFEEIAKVAPRIDWAMLPIGAYAPEWFMAAQHMNPEDAIRAFQILGARKFVAMHHSTFDMTDEPLDEPLDRLYRGFARQGLDCRRLWLLGIGQTRPLGRR